MSDTTYDIGDIARVRAASTSRPLTDAERATFEDDGTLPASVGVNPSSTTFTVVDPDGTETAPSIQNPATGSFYIDYPVTANGRHYYRFAGTGTNQAAEEGHFYVRRQEVT